MSIDDLTSHLLIATQNNRNFIFYQSVIYICEHAKRGSLGFIINQPTNLNLTDLLKQMDVPLEGKNFTNHTIFSGGPLKPNQGFVLHSTEELWSDSIPIQEDIALSSSSDILRATVDNRGPKSALFLLGYSAWEPGQLEKEIIDNRWFVASSAASIIFDVQSKYRWRASMKKLGVNLIQITLDAGHA